MRFPSPTDDQRLSGDAVLAVVAAPAGAAALSPFEAAVLSALDGVRDNDAVARALGVAPGDLRIALGALLLKGHVVEAAARPALRLPPKTPLPRAPTPSPSQAPSQAPLVLLHDDRVGAASLQARSLRALRRGDLRDARSLAEEATRHAPGVASHRQLLDGWDDHVARNLGAELHGKARVDVVKDVVAAHPRAAGAWSLLAALLEADDVAAAADAAKRAAAIAPTPERERRAQKLAAAAAAAGRFARLKSLFSPPAAPARRR